MTRTALDLTEVAPEVRVTLERTALLALLSEIDIYVTIQRHQPWRNRHLVALEHDLERYRAAEPLIAEAHESGSLSWFDACEEYRDLFDLVLHRANEVPDLRAQIADLRSRPSEWRRSLLAAAESRA